MPKNIVESSWFAFFDLACASASCLIWYFLPGSGWWPLLLGLAPWALRLSSGFFPFKRTPFDLALLLFLLTAGVGVWASYNPPAAWDKFWLIVGSVLLYYALAGQPETNLGLVFGLVGVLATAVALSVLFDTNLGNYHPDLNFVHELSRGWEAIRPAWEVNALPPNVSGGILAGLLPFPLLLTSEFFRKDKIVFGLATLLMVAVMSLALFLSSSRGAWIAISVAMSIALMWVGSRFVLRSFSRSIQFVFAAVLLAILVLVIGFIITSSGGLSSALDRIPGLPSGTSRVELALNTINLSADFPFTGGGLSAFSGLYSKYILVIPHLFVEYSNFYLDIYLEQGLLGGVTISIVFLGSLLFVLIALMKPKEDRGETLLQLAVLAGLVVILVHGLVDDALYGVRGTPLLFLVPGMGMALRSPAALATVETGQKRRIKWGKLIGVSALLVFLAVAAFGQSAYQPVIASWYANLGSVYMAKAELFDFPSGSFDYFPNEGLLKQAKGYFKRALLADPQNTTANYRLGIIASEERDFQTAIPYLETAFQGNEDHRGIQKVLGYNYAWTARPDLAVEMLAEIPEARGELDVYVRWWRTKGRADLATKTQTTLSLMDEQSN